MVANGRLRYYRHDSDRAYVLHALFPDKNSITEHASFFALMIKAKLDESAWSYIGFFFSCGLLLMNNFLRYNRVPGKYIDIVKDVIYPSMAHVAADKLVRVWFHLPPVCSDVSVVDRHSIEDKGES